MAENGDVVVDWGLNVEPALAAAKKLEAVLNGIHANLANTSGLVAKQVKATVDEYNRLIATLDQSKPAGRLQALALESRKNTDANRQVKDYELYGPPGKPADDMRDQMVAFRRELNAQRQTADRLFSALAKDMIQGQIDAIRTQVNVAKARITEEAFAASALLRRTTPQALQARAVLDQERLDRSIRSADRRQVEFRELRDRTRDERNLNVPLQTALAAQRARNDQRRIYSESAEGQLEKTVDAARKEAGGYNAYLDSLAAANRRAAEIENVRRDQAARSLRQEAEETNRRRDQADRSLRQSAEVENRRRDAAERTLRQRAEEDNRRRDQASASLRREADEINRRRDQANRALRAEAEAENARRDQANKAFDKAYRDAERENRLRDKLKANASRERIAEIKNAPDLQEIKLRRAQQQAADDRERARIGDAAFANKRIAERVSDPSFLGVQASIMGNYFALTTVFNTIKGLGSFIVQFDEQLQQLKAISQATTTEMKGLTQTFIEVGQASKFSTVDIAKAATTMAQAGLSANEIAKTIGSVVKLATASGSSLDSSVDLVTSIIGAFNLQGSETEKIADVVTEALNRTKLSVDKLALGVQYSANIAADAGISYTELTAILGQLAQTGIRSGSTLGTGLRQLLVDLSKPSEKFTEIVGGLGLTMADVDVKTNGFLGVLSNLKQAGFTAADAIQSFEVRAAASYTALSNNVEGVAKLNASFATTKAATEAADTQMGSLSATYQNFINQISAATYVGFTPTISALQQVIAGGGQAFALLSQYPSILKAIGLAASLAIGAVTIGLFGKLAAAIRFAAGEMLVFRGLTAGIATFGLGPVLGGVAAAIGLAAAGFYAFNQTTETTADRLEKVKTTANSIQGALDSTTQSISSIEKTINALTTQGAALDQNPILRAAKIAEVKAQFADLGLRIDDSTNSVAALITRLEELSQKLSGKAVVQYTEQIANLVQQQKLLNAEIEKEKGTGLPRIARGADPARLEGRLETALKTASGFLGGPVAVPKTAAEYDDLRSRLAVRRSELEGDRLSLQNRDGPGDQRRIYEIDKTLATLAKAITTIANIGQKQSELEQGKIKLEQLEQSRVAQRFRESKEALAIGRANQDLTELSVSAPRTVAQSTDTQIAYQGIRDEQTSLLKKQEEAVRKAREFLVGQGNTLDQANKILDESGLTQKGTEAAETVRTSLDKINDSINVLLKKRAEQISDRVNELASSVNINSSLDRINGAITGIANGVADKFDATAQQVKGFGYVSGSSKGEIIRKAVEAAKAGGADPAAILATIQKESGFNRDARSPTNARGLFQFIRSTGNRFGYQYGVDLDTELTAGINHYNYNKNLLDKSLRRESNPFENYLAHMIGFGGAKLAIKGDPSGGAVAQLGKLASLNGSSGQRAGESLGQFLGRHKATYEKLYGGALDVLGKVDPDVQKLESTQRLKVKAEAKRTSDALAAESKEQLKELDVIAAQARRTKTPEAFDGLIKKANELVPSLVDKQIQSLKESPEFKERLEAGEPDAIKELKEKEDALRTAAQEKVDKIVNAKFEAAIKAAKQPVEEAQLKLDNLKANINSGNATEYEVKQAENALQEAQRVEKLKVQEIQAQRTAEAERALKQAESSGNKDELVRANDRYTDSLTRQKEAADEATAANNKTPPLDFARATQGSTYSFLNSAGVMDASGGIKSGAQQWGEAWQQVLGGAQSAFASLSTSLTQDPKNWKNAIKGFGMSFIQMFTQMIAKALSLQIIMGLFGDGKENSGLLGGLGGGAGGLFSGLFSTPAAGASGGGFLSGIGSLLGFAGGGEVPDSTTPNRDSRLVKAMPGEVIMRRAAVKAIGKERLLELNTMGSNVTQMSQPMAMADQPKPEPSLTNVYVVAPDDKPQMGPKDVIAVVTDDMKRRGATRQLIKSIQQGAA